jgi:hypothetical protein
MGIIIDLRKEKMTPEKMSPLDEDSLVISSDNIYRDDGYPDPEGMGRKCMTV